MQIAVNREAFKMSIRIFIAAVLSALILLPAFSANARTQEKSKTPTWLFDFTKADHIYQRPANFYRLKKSLDKQICNEILGKLNEEGLEVKDGNYNHIFTGNSTSFKWEKKPIKDSVQYVEYTSYKPKKSNLTWSYLRLISQPMGGMYNQEISRNTIGWRKDEEYFSKQEAERLVYTDEAYVTILDFGEKNSVERMFPGFKWPSARGQDMMLLQGTNEKLIGLVTDENPDHFCQNHYHVLASWGDEIAKRFFPICHFVSIPKIVCKQ